MPNTSDECIYLALYSNGECCEVSASGEYPSRNGRRVLADYLDEGWVPLCESPAGSSESSLMTLRRSS